MSRHNLQSPPWDHREGRERKHTPGPLTPAMLRELHAIERGDVGDLLDYGSNALAFYARDRVIGALERRGLIAPTPDWSLTDAGRSAIAKAKAAGSAA